MSQPFADSLPHALIHQARVRGTRIALRSKRLGIWHTRTWSDLADEVGRLAGALSDLGFVPDSELLIISEAKAEALLLALAAHWLGGHASLLDPVADHRGIGGIRTPGFVVAQDLETALQLHDAAPPVLIVLESRGLNAAQIPGVIASCALLEGQATTPDPVAQATGIAFRFPSREGEPELELRQDDLLIGARRLVDSQGLTQEDEALAAKVFAAGGQARYLLAPWLVAGFSLNFPEALSTRDNDRREVGPTLVLGTRESYARLEHWVRERLPLPGSFSHWLYRRAMTSVPGTVGHRVGYWLVRRPLLDVLGMSRLDTPLLVGAELTEESAVFFKALGIAPRRLDALNVFQTTLDSPASTAFQPA